VKVTVDRERCIGAGMCALTAPEVFDQDEEDGRVILLDADPPTAHHAVRDAATLCPSGSITLSDHP
jgi:ferredoxin